MTVAAKYKVGDNIRMTTLTWGEAITDRNGVTLHQTPMKAVYAGTVKYVGPECPFPSAEVVRCTGGNTALKLDNGFQFYPKDNGQQQTVEIVQ